MINFSKLVLKPTIHCFHQCIYCDSRQNFYKSFNKISHGYMDIKLAKKVVNEAHSLGMKECLISGGDPLLYPYLEELIREVKKFKEVFLHINSVGSRLTEWKAKEIMNAGLDGWNISLDSPYPKSHNQWRGVRTAWEDSIKAIEILSDLRERYSQFSNFKFNFMSVVTRYNYKDIPELISLAISKKASSVHLMNIYGDDIENKFLLSVDQIIEFKTVIIPKIISTLIERKVPEIVIRNAEDLLSRFFNIENNSFDNYAKGIYWNDVEIVKKLCNQPNFYSLIETTGDVLPCCLVEIFHTEKVGNVLSNSLIDIWKGSEYQFFRDNRLPFCEKCPTPYQITIGLTPDMCRDFSH